MNEEEQKNYEPPMNQPPSWVLQRLQAPLEEPIDPLCQNDKYIKGKNPWCLSLTEKLEKRPHGLTPQEIKDKYKEYQENEWKSKSRCNKILTLVWALPYHIYRKYLSSEAYRQYYNSLYWYINNTK